MKKYLCCIFLCFMMIFLNGCIPQSHHPPSMDTQDYEISKTRFRSLYQKEIIHHVIISHSQNPGKKSKIYDISKQQNENIIAWIKDQTLFVKAKNGHDIVAPVDMDGFFAHGRYVKSISIENMDTFQSTTMKKLFMDCPQLKSVSFQFDARSLEDCSFMYADCFLLEDFSGHFSNICQIKNTSYMYRNCRNLKEYNEETFNFSSVENATGMFYGCIKLKNVIFTSRTNNLKDCSYMFQLCYELKYLDLSNFYTRKLRNTSYMFDNCWVIEEIDLTSFDTTSLQDTTQMFSNCPHLRTIIVSSGWVCDNIKKSEKMFYASFSLPNFNPKIIDKIAATIGDEGYLSYR